MKRNIYSKLLDWKISNRRKPLVIKGARQVGKSWIMEEFAKNEYQNYVLIDFSKEKIIGRIFEQTKETQKIIEQIELIKSTKIIPGKTLLILDEIQDCPDALATLKYFNEEANEYHIMTAGSLLGTLLSQNCSYPVGKVNLLDVHPFTFDEFLRTLDNGMYKYFSSVYNENDYVEAFHERLLDYYRLYLIVGGMPEAIKSWTNNKNPDELSAIQNEIISLYEDDFTKHNGDINSGKLLQVFRSIIPQLAKENNEKFMYTAIAKSARARDFEEAIEWIVSSGIANRLKNISTPKYPIKAYEILNNFKLFLVDVGLLKYMANITNKSILVDESFQFKGQMTENYVLQQLVPQTDNLHFYSMGFAQEIDFIIQREEKIVPIEIKSSKNKSATSFKNYIKKYDPSIAIRFNTNGFMKNGKITNIPLYFASRLEKLDL